MQPRFFGWGRDVRAGIQRRPLHYRIIFGGEKQFGLKVIVAAIRRGGLKGDGKTGVGRN